MHLRSTLVIAFLVPILALLASVRAAPFSNVQKRDDSDCRPDWSIYLVYDLEQGAPDPPIFNAGGENNIPFILYWCTEYPNPFPVSVEFTLARLVSATETRYHSLGTMKVNFTDTSYPFTLSKPVDSGDWFLNYKYRIDNDENSDESKLREEELTAVKVQ
ncbi:hypothetical protein BC826DRAFT_989770 [Russula brevipes]|nr:hypothetical protein BC826DRAFT_989770 [Russula brevipes]